MIKEHDFIEIEYTGKIKENDFVFDTTDKKIIFNRTVTLRDQWARIKKVS